MSFASMQISAISKQISFCRVIYGDSLKSPVGAETSQLNKLVSAVVLIFRQN